MATSREIAERLFGGNNKDKLANAQPGNNSSWLSPGSYLLKLGVVKMKERRNNKPPGFLIEGTITKVLGTHAEFKPMTVGTLAAQGIWSGSDWFYPNCKKFVAAACDMRMDDVSNEDIYQVIEDDNPLAEQTMEVHCVNLGLKDKESGEPTGNFTVCNWQRGLVSASRLVELFEGEEEALHLYYPDIEELLAIELEDEEAEGEE